MIVKGGKLYYDLPIGILCLESQFPKLRGHLRNPISFSFPTVTRVVEGVDIPCLLFNPTLDLVEPFIKVAKQLEEDGVQAISGSCGFMARFQGIIASELKIPVILSSLVQIPMIRIMHGKNAKIGVLTASSNALTVDHFDNCGTCMDDVIIHGMEHNTEFRETILEGKRNYFDIDALRGIVGTAKNFVNKKQLDALVLECTDLSVFSHDIQKKIEKPIYDINSLIEFTYSVVCRKQYS